MFSRPLTDFDTWFGLRVGGRFPFKIEDWSISGSRSADGSAIDLVMLVIWAYTVGLPTIVNPSLHVNALKSSSDLTAF